MLLLVILRESHVIICHAYELCNTYIEVTLRFFIILVESGYLVMTAAYKRPFLLQFSLSFLSFFSRLAFKHYQR